jgi:TolB-like protein
MLRMPSFRTPASILLLALGACSAHRPLAPAAVADIPALEAGLAAAPDNAATLFRLGTAYRQAGRLEEAGTVLQRLAALRPDHADAALHLGLTYEDMGRVQDAHRQYQQFLTLGGGPATERMVRGRLRLLERQQLLLAVRDAVAAEATMAATPPRTGTVGVFPFLFSATDPALEPLGRGLAELLVTDLAQTGRLTVLERARVQLLLDEIRLAADGLVEPSSAARTGRMLGAAHIVQGQVLGDSDALRLQAAVLDVASAAMQGSPIAEEDALRRLFDMQKRIALQVYESLGIQLTAAERERVERRPTRNVRALLEFGLGLAADDEGRYVDARRHFAAAARADGGFTAARQRATTAAEAAAAAAATTNDLARQAALDADGNPDALAALDGLVPGSSRRDAGSEVLGREGLGARDAVIQIIIRRN